MRLKDCSQQLRLGAFLYINDIKGDIIEYPIPFFNIETLEGIRLASKLDIAAMKINAITNRGTRKDFYDLYELLKEFSLKEIIDSYKEKYNIDLRKLALTQIKKLGIKDENMSVMEYCTYSSKDEKGNLKFHSHRRDRTLSMNMALFLGKE